MLSSDSSEAGDVSTVDDPKTITCPKAFALCFQVRFHNHIFETFLNFEPCRSAVYSLSCDTPRLYPDSGKVHIILECLALPLANFVSF